jgi:hypothetical protein
MLFGVGEIHASPRVKVPCFSVIIRCSFSGHDTTCLGLQGFNIYLSSAAMNWF